MAGKQFSAASRLVAELPRGPEGDAAGRDFFADGPPAVTAALGKVERTADRERILAGLLDAAAPNLPPTDEEILGLILGEIVLIATSRPLPASDQDRASGR